MQNGREGCFPKKIIPHASGMCALTYQASSRRFFLLLSTESAEDPTFGMASPRIFEKALLVSFKCLNSMKHSGNI